MELGYKLSNISFITKINSFLDNYNQDCPKKDQEKFNEQNEMVLLSKY